MATNRLKLLGVQVAVPTAAERSARGPRARLAVDIDVENRDKSALHVWASGRGYEYDRQSKVLTLHLSEQARPERPGVIIISQHPRAPAQIEVAAGDRTTLHVEIPAVTRHAASDGRGWVEEPIGEVSRVDVDVQYAPEPLQPVEPHETAERFHARSRAHGHVVQAKLKPSSGGTEQRKKD